MLNATEHDEYIPPREFADGNEDPRLKRWMVLGIVAALAVWGGMLALGAYLSGVERGLDTKRGLIVAGSFVAFVAVWLLLFRARFRGAPRSR